MKIVLRNRKAQLISPSLPAYLVLLNDVFYYEKSFHEIKFLPRGAPRTCPMIDADGSFWIGLLGDVCSFFQRLGVDYEIIDERTQVDKSYLKTVMKRLERMPFALRDYQKEALRQGLKYFDGLFYIATGGGKTVIMAALITSINKKTLIVVDSMDLARQLYNELMEYTGRPESHFNIIDNASLTGNLQKDVNRISKAKINIALASSLVNKRFGEAKRNAMQVAVLDAECLIVDEAHHCQSPTFQKVIESCVNARLFYQFTATPMTSIFKGEKKNTKKDILFKAMFGKILFKKTTADLIAEGWLAKPNIYFMRNRLNYDGDEILGHALEFEEYIMENEDRNRLICKIANQYYENDKQVIIFVTRVDHGGALIDMLEDEFGVDPDKMAYVTGTDEKDDRINAISSFKNNEVKILVGTVLSEGLNFFCDVGINAAAGRSEIKAIQRLGRILRKKRTETGDIDRDKVETVDFYDFRDFGHPMFRRQSLERAKLFRSEGHTVIEIEVEEDDETQENVF